MYTLCMYPNVTPDSSSNFCPQHIHMSPNEPGCVQTSTFTDDSAKTETRGVTTLSEQNDKLED